MTDVADAVGIAHPGRTRGEDCVADLNGDGLTDLLLSAHEDRWHLYLGQADGRFVRGYNIVFEARDRHGCAVADFDADGLFDIYISIGACRGTCTAPKELWIQQDDHTFIDSAVAWGVSDPGGRGRVPIVLDANGDDLPDLFTGQGETVEHPSLNRLWINRGDHFELQEDGPLTNGRGNLCAAAADVDGDGLDELALCTPRQGFSLYRNDGGTFVEDTAGFELDDHGLRTVEFGDFDADGRPDLVTVERTRVRVHLNQKGRFRDAVFTERLKDGKDVGIGDADGDGDLDIYAQQGAETSDPDLLLLNDGDGRAFTLGAEVPSIDSGAGDTVVGIPNWNGTARSAFLVSNGYQDHAGPRQLIELSDR